MIFVLFILATIIILSMWKHHGILWVILRELNAGSIESQIVILIELSRVPLLIRGHFIDEIILFFFDLIYFFMALIIGWSTGFFWQVTIVMWEQKAIELFFRFVWFHWCNLNFYE